jgi:protein involved in polysaccharide export with SLBB domain
MLKFRRHLFFLSCLLLLQAANFAQTPENVLPPMPESKIHFGDLIDVDVIGSTEYDWRGTITPEGFLNGIDFVEEPIYALCRSEEDVARQLEKGYAKLLREPKVVVRILDRSGRPVSVLYGAVRTPQRFRIERAARLNELIILSGGITERASGEIQIFRPEYLSCEPKKKSNHDDEASQNNEPRERFVAAREAGGATSVTIKIADLLSGKADANPLILTGDIVTVLEAEPIYVIGGVNAPKQISSRSRLTLTRAIASAGGLTRNADPKKVTIFRREKNETKIIEIDFEAVKSGASEDFVLKAFDIVEIGERGKSPRKMPPVVRFAENDQTNAANLPLRIID